MILHCNLMGLLIIHKQDIKTTRIYIIISTKVRVRFLSNTLESLTITIFSRNSAWSFHLSSSAFIIPECHYKQIPVPSLFLPNTLPITLKSLRKKASLHSLTEVDSLVHWELVSLVARMSVLTAMASVLVVVVVPVVVPLVALVSGAGCGMNHNLTVLPVNFRA